MFSTDFDQQEQSFRTNKTTKAIATTVLFHALFLLALYFTIINVPIPPFPEEENGGGVEVNFGFDEMGTGDIQAFSENPGPMTSSHAAPSKSSSGAPKENFLADENADNDVIVPKNEKTETKKPNKDALFEPRKNNSSTNNNTNKPTATENKTPVPTANKDALFTKGAAGKPNNSTGDGTGGGKGDQGRPDGDPNSRDYLGNGGSGSGPGSGDLNGGYSLRGRSKVYIPKPANCNSKGKVVITIRVDKAGNVTEAKFKRFDSTVFDDCNVNNALTAARKATFTPDANAPDIQEGTITYIYKVN